MRTAVRLDSLHFHDLVAHLLALPPQDRRMRFGRAMTDEAIVEYVGGIDFERDAVYAVVDPVLDIAGALHLVCRTRGLELGLSVLPQARGAGIGTRLLERAAQAARERGATRLYVRDLARNEAMQRLARRVGMPIIVPHDDTDGALEHALAAEQAARATRTPAVLLDASLSGEPRPAARATLAHPVRPCELHP